MALTPPAVDSEPVDALLGQAFALAGADWKSARNTKPEKPYLCTPPKPKAPAKGAKGKGAGAAAAAPPRATGDRWLRMEFPAMALDLATALRIDEASRRDLTEALRTARLETVPVPTTVARLLQGGLRDDGAPRSSTLKRGVISRTDACPIITAYLQPLLEPVAYERWLEEMAGTRFFLRGGREGDPWVPDVVRRTEHDRDRELARRWVGQPPAMKPLPPDASEQLRKREAARHEKEAEPYRREQGRIRAYLPNEPGAPDVLLEPSGRDERKVRAWFARAAREGRLPLVVFRDGPAPANLFISEAVAQVNTYLALMQPVIRGATANTPLYGTLMGSAYAMLAVAMIPVNCLYDEYHGTCTIESVVPGVLRATEVMERFAARTLPRIVAAQLRGGQYDEDDPQVARLLDGFGRWARALADGTRRATFQLLRTAADQSGGRVRTPVRMAPGGEWKFVVEELQEDGTREKVERRAAEAISYGLKERGGGRVSERETDREIFWILQSLWSPIATAIALANQSGARVWINAANNRWGGHHPPHVTHRQGNTFDIDASLEWIDDAKVPNVVRRDKSGRPLSDEEEPDNSSNAPCLQLTDRLVGWIVTQAFVLVGVSQYLYGDAALLEHAAMHLSERIGLVKPGRLDGQFEPSGHHNHWHFELLVGDRPGGMGDYVWQVKSATLLDQLHELAVARDADPEFWKKFAGLDKVPEEDEDFDGLEDAEDWVRWWNRRHGPAGIPLLPIWAPGLVNRTFEWNQCTPRGDFELLFGPGEAPA